MYFHSGGDREGEQDLKERNVFDREIHKGPEGL